MSAKAFRCPECGLWVKANTPSCPQCGEQFPETELGSDPHRGFPILPVIISLCVIASVGGVAYLALRHKPEPRPDPSPAPALVQGLPELETPLGPAPHTLLVLRADTPAEDAGREPNEPMLARELVRQAVLIAAREELGLQTRDVSLGEGAGPEHDRVSLTPEIEFVPHQGVTLTLVFGEGAEARRIGRETLSDPWSEAPSYAELIDRATAFSRTPCPEMLAKLGYPPQESRQPTEGGIPAELDALLSQMSFPLQFAAVRELHTLLREEGHSPDRWAALARAYANLGLLTEHFLNPIEKVFKARALLYAARATVPGDPQGLWTQAYVAALVGLPALAAEHLSAADALPDPPAEPDWLPLIRAYVQHDPEPLGAHFGDARIGELARLLHFFAIATPMTAEQSLRVGRELLEEMPTCYRVYDACCEFQGVRNLQQMTALAPATFAAKLPGQLEAIPHCPAFPEIDYSQRTAITELGERFVAAGFPGQDSGEPSWAVLGQLIRDTNLVHAARRLAFMIGPWSGGVEPDLDFWTSLPGSHPDSNLLRGYVDYALGNWESCLAVTRDFLEKGRDASVLSYLSEPMALAETLPSEAVDNVSRSGDGLSREMELVLPFLALPGQEAVVRLLSARDPHSPLALALTLRMNPQLVADRIATWTPESNLHPAVHSAVAEYYVVLGEGAKAAAHLRQSLAQSPDGPTYQVLASLYLNQGDAEKWLAILEEYLEVSDDPGLEHAQVRVQIANQFMTMGEWDKALPYAEAAADTGAAWAMLCANRCAEGAEQWAKAEQWIRRVSERYPEAITDWFFWCLRTGQGNQEQAFDLIREGYEPHRLTVATSGALVYALCLLSNGDRSGAVEYLHERVREQAIQSSLEPLYLAALAHAEGNTPARDDAFQQLAQDDPEGAPLYEPFKASLESGQQLDLTALEDLVRFSPNRGVLLLLLAFWLEGEDRLNEAKAQYRQIQADWNTAPYLLAIAAAELRRLEALSEPPSL